MSSRYPIALALLLFASTARGAPRVDPDCPGQQNPGGIWKVNSVDVYFNASLDPNLEQAAVCTFNNIQMAYPLGDATSRRQCFSAAVDAWNVALTNLCGDGKTPLQLVLKPEDNGLWGVDQSQTPCIGGGPNIYVRVPLHNNDSKNVGSTGHNHFLNKDGANNVLGPGWIQADEITTESPERLAETYPRLAGGGLAEADIGWMTHFKDQCAEIPWDYRLFKVNNPPCEAVVPEPNSYDFYSVMLHELGHLLGLGHISDPDGKITDNCMGFTIKRGERKQITKLETDCLKKLYCIGATPAPKPTWGGLKRLYR